jgi:peptidoglycan/LPS O-acetylase OafA/YrhL
MQNAIHTGELLFAMVATAVPCLLFDYALFAIQRWQQKRFGASEPAGLGWIARTFVSLILNGFTGVLVAYLYRLIGTEEQDAFVIGASLWLMVSIPILFTSRFMEEGQKKVLASRILGWLLKVAIAATAAAFIVEKGG